MSATIATVCAETAENLNRTALVMGKGIVELLASKYGFDAAEAFEAISFEVPKKAKKAAAEKKEKGEGSDKLKKSKLPLPFVGIVKAEWCMGIRTNHGLFTQCTNPAPGEGKGEYCPTCAKQAEANASGKPTYGNIKERVEALEQGIEWRDPKDNKLVSHYANVAAKLKINLDDANAECNSVFGIDMPADMLEVKVSQRGRPKKDGSAIVSDTDSATSADKKRGRPKKVKEVIEGGAAGDDLIAGLVAEAQNGQTRPKKAKVSAVELTEEEKAAKKKEAAEKRKATLAEKKASQPPKPEPTEEELKLKRQQAAEKRKAAAEAKKQAFIQAAALALLQAQGFSSAAASTAASSAVVSDTEATPKSKPKSKPVVVAAPAPAPIADSQDDELEIEDIPEADVEVEEVVGLEVEEWLCPLNNKLYLKSPNNVLYDADTQDEIGVWNESKKVIDRLTTDDEDDMC